MLAEHWRSFLADTEARDEGGRGLPRFVVDEVEAFLKCGILAHGFIRVACDTCRQSRVVAFACKRRGFCPSCLGRRMCGDRHAYFERFTATYLVLDNVPKAVTVEAVSPNRGDQIDALVERLVGLRYDPDRGMLDMSLEDRVIALPPMEIWILEPDDPGCVSIVEVVGSDGSKDIVYVWRGGGLTRRYEDA